MGDTERKSLAERLVPTAPEPCPQKAIDVRLQRLVSNGRRRRSSDFRAVQRDLRQQGSALRKPN